MMGKLVQPKASHAGLSGGNTFVCKGMLIILLAVEEGCVLVYTIGVYGVFISLSIYILYIYIYIYIYI